MQKVARTIKAPLYEKDFYKWSVNQSSFLKNGDFSMLDFENLAEEIESLGKSDKRALRNHLVNLLMHMLKTKYQPEKQTRSWEKSISNAKDRIDVLLQDSPSLKVELKSIFDSAYQRAKVVAAQETKIDISEFPEQCPWKAKEVMTGDKK